MSDLIEITSPTKPKVSSKDYVDPRQVRLIWQEAMYEASLTKGTISISWKNLPFIDPVLYDFHRKFGKPLLHLRIIGSKLKTFPEEFAPNFEEMEVLSIENNVVEHIPDNITLMTQLRELYLANNLLHHLPERIGFLCHLHTFSINNNKLQELPATFSALNLLRRVDLECNELRMLPDNLDHLTHCEVLNLNRNKLVRLPKTIGAMPSLTSLSACWNELTQLPSEICHSRTLSILRLAMNKIHILPERLGQLSESLTELTVEYNQLRGLPLSFHKLRKLHVFRCEGNDRILDPPPETLIQGAHAVIKYCVHQYYYDKDARMRHIVLALQNVLMQVTEKNLYDPAFFEAEAHQPYGDDNADQDPDGWFVFQMPYFWTQLLTKMRSLWLMQEQQGVYDGANYNNEDVTSFDFTEKEVMWALTHYHDAMGPILLRQSARFKRCACIHPVTKQRVPCVPPKVGYMCERPATWLKMKIVRSRDKAERKWSTYKIDHENDAVRRAEVEALEYLNSRVGQRWLDETAAEQADDVLLEQTVDKIVHKRIAQTEKAKEKVLNKFDKLITRVQRIKDDKFQKLTQEVNALKDQLRTTREGYLKNVLEKKLEELSKTMADIPEIEQLQNLQLQCQKEIDQLEANLYKGIESEEDENEKAAAAKAKAKARRKRRKQRERRRNKNKNSHNNDTRKRNKHSDDSSDDSDGDDNDSFTAKKKDDGGETAAGGGGKDKEGDVDSDISDEKDHDYDKREEKDAAKDAFVSDEEDDLIECMDSDELRIVVQRDRQDIKNHQQMYDSDDSCSEARTYRRLRLKRMKRLKLLEEAKLLQETQHQHVERQIHQLKEDKGRKSLRLAVDLFMLQTSHRNRVIAQTLKDTTLHKTVVKPMKRYLREQRVLARRKLRDLVEISKIRTAKVLRRLNGDFNEVVRELTYEIRRQYIAHAMSQARDAARHEFAVIERLRSKMLGASLEMTFIAWKKYVWTKTERERRDKRRVYKQACKHYETSMESVRSAQLQANMWHRQLDIYSDREYWQHKRTGDITYDEPTMYHYLPWNFVLPSLPEELSSDISLHTTDNSDLNEDDDAKHNNKNNRAQQRLDDQQKQALTQAVRDTFQQQQQQHGQNQNEPDDQQSVTTVDKNKRKQAAGDPENGGGGAPSKRSVHEELIRWQAKYGQKRHAAQDADEQKRAQRRLKREQYRMNVTAAAAQATATLQQQQQQQSDETKTKKNKNNKNNKRNRANRFGIVPLAPPPPAPTNYNPYHTNSNSSANQQSGGDNMMGTIYEHSTDKYSSSYQYGYGDEKQGHENEEEEEDEEDEEDEGLVLTAFNTDELIAPLATRIAEASEHLAVQAKNEYEIAYKAIRRKRNQLNPLKHEMYMSHVNRKPKSMEQFRLEHAQMSEQEAKEHALEIEPGVFIDDRKVDLLHPSEETLLKMAGGDINMIYTGKAGLELRSVIAARALHIKEKLHERAIERGLISRSHDHNTVYRKEIKPFFMHRFDGSDSSENTDDDDDDHKKDDDDDNDSSSKSFAQSFLGMFGLGGGQHKKKKTVSKQTSTQRTRAASLDPQGKLREGKHARERHRELYHRLKEERHRDKQYHGQVDENHADRKEMLKMGNSPER